MDEELVVCESVIDALSLWCNGFRHVTAAYGTSGWTPDHDGLVDRLGVKRVPRRLTRTRRATGARPTSRHR